MAFNAEPERLRHECRSIRFRRTETVQPGRDIRPDTKGAAKGTDEGTDAGVIYDRTSSSEFESRKRTGGSVNH